MLGPGSVAHAPVVLDLTFQAPTADVAEMKAVNGIITKIPTAAQDLNTITKMLQARNEPQQ